MGSDFVKHLWGNLYMNHRSHENIMLNHSGRQCRSFRYTIFRPPMMDSPKTWILLKFALLSKDNQRCGGKVETCVLSNTFVSSVCNLPSKPALNGTEPKNKPPSRKLLDNLVMTFSGRFKCSKMLNTTITSYCPRSVFSSSISTCLSEVIYVQLAKSCTADWRRAELWWNIFRYVFTNNLVAYAIMYKLRFIMRMGLLKTNTLNPRGAS